MAASPGPAAAAEVTAAGGAVDQWWGRGCMDPRELWEVRRDPGSLLPGRRLKGNPSRFPGVSAVGLCIRNETSPLVLFFTYLFPHLVFPLTRTRWEMELGLPSFMLLSTLCSS